VVLLKTILANKLLALFPYPPGDLMIPSSLRSALDTMLPKMNPHLARGLAVTHMEDAPAALHRMISITMDAITKATNGRIKYLGLRRCTPEENRIVLSKRSSADIWHDIARHDLLLLRMEAECDGIRLTPRFMAIPFLSDGGKFHLSDSVLKIGPVLSDQVISVSPSAVFAKLLKIKLTFAQTLGCYDSNFNPQRQRESVALTWAYIFNTSNRTKRKTAPKTSLVHYLFCEHGVTPAFKKYLGIDVHVGVKELSEDVRFRSQGAELAVVNQETHPPENWVVCSSAGIRSKKSKSIYVSPLQIAIRKEDYTLAVREYVCAFFYVVDNFCDHSFQFQYDSPAAWQFFLGLILKGDTTSSGKIISEMAAHINSIKSYMDTIVKTMLEGIGYHCDDFYDFLAMVVGNYSKWMFEQDKKGNCRYDKELQVLPYVLYDYVRSANNLMFLLTSRGNTMRFQEIDTAFGDHIRPTLVFELSKGGHGEVSTCMTEGDNIALKCSMELTPQTASSGAAGADPGESTNNPADNFHATFAIAHQLFAVPKGTPSGVSTLNHFAPIEIINGHWVLRPRELDKELLELTQENLTRALP
jgi:hypothetical protein